MQSILICQSCILPVGRAVCQPHRSCLAHPWVAGALHQFSLDATGPKWSVVNIVSAIDF